jgi:hypothetical protein
MIFKALLLLVRQLNQFILAISEANSTNEEVVLGNISLIESSNGNNTNISRKVVLSLVNVEEERTMKNGPHFKQDGLSVRYLNPAVNLNLYLLFSANYEDYENALKRLSQVIAFFQGKNIFTYANSPVADLAGDPEVMNMKLILDLYTLTFEQINHLWGSLGGKQVPFVMYKMRLVTIQTDTIQKGGGVIEEIEANNTLIS